jgi:Cu-Zn family superoxide dismutase
MRTRRVFTLALALPLVAAGAEPSRAAHVVLKDATGATVGTATLTEDRGGVHLSVKVQGMPPGTHAIHIHAVGRCENPEFKSAGPHFNPGGKKHGMKNPEGHHAGDLPNLVVGANGKTELHALAHGATLGDGPASLFGTQGTALVVHAGPDDEVTDPAGNSGARIACGVITRGN